MSPLGVKYTVHYISFANVGPKSFSRPENLPSLPPLFPLQAISKKVKWLSPSRIKATRVFSCGRDFLLRSFYFRRILTNTNGVIGTVIGIPPQLPSKMPAEAGYRENAAFFVRLNAPPLRRRAKDWTARQPEQATSMSFQKCR